MVVESSMVKRAVVVAFRFRFRVGKMALAFDSRRPLSVP